MPSTYPSSTHTRGTPTISCEKRNLQLGCIFERLIVELGRLKAPLQTGLDPVRVIGHPAGIGDTVLVMPAGNGARQIMPIKDALVISRLWFKCSAALIRIEPNLAGLQIQ
jgi:hypothetical protein